MIQKNNNNLAFSKQFIIYKTPTYQISKEDIAKRQKVAQINEIASSQQPIQHLSSSKSLTAEFLWAIVGWNHTIKAVRRRIYFGVGGTTGNVLTGVIFNIFIRSHANFSVTASFMIWSDASRATAERWRCR